MLPHHRCYTLFSLCCWGGTRGGGGGGGQAYFEGAGATPCHPFRHVPVGKHCFTDRSSALTSFFPPTGNFGPRGRILRSTGHRCVSMFWSISVISLELNCITMAYICCVCGPTRHSRPPAGSRSDSVLINMVSCLSVCLSVCSLSVCLSVCQ